MPILPDPFRRLCSGFTPTKLTLLRAGMELRVSEKSFVVLAMVAIFTKLFLCFVMKVTFYQLPLFIAVFFGKTPLLSLKVLRNFQNRQYRLTVFNDKFRIYIVFCTITELSPHLV